MMNKAMSFELDPVEHLKQLRGTVCDYLRFPGNYGDALIWHGTKVALTRASIKYRTIGCGDTPGADVLIVDGGGNLIDLYTDVSDFLNKYGMRYSEVVVLPHTVTGASPLASLRRLGRKLTVFCRERVSWLNVFMSAPDARCYLWHDCAFYLELQRSCSARLRQSRLSAFRTDIETTGITYPIGNRDLSREGYALSPIEPLLDFLSQHSTIATDRLHVAIAASLIGCDVELYGNSYYKNRAVFEYSLKGRANVVFRA